MTACAAVNILSTTRLSLILHADRNWLHVTVFRGTWMLCPVIFLLFGLYLIHYMSTSLSLLSKCWWWIYFYINSYDRFCLYILHANCICVSTLNRITTNKINTVQLCNMIFLWNWGVVLKIILILQLFLWILLCLIDYFLIDF